MKNSIDNETLEQFRPFIAREAKKFARASNVCDHHDLEQAGYMGLMAAKKTFDSTKDVKWSTYAIQCIRNEILSEAIKFVKDFTVPKRAALDYHKIKRLINQGKERLEIQQELEISDKYFNTLNILIQLTTNNAYSNNSSELENDAIESIYFNSLDILNDIDAIYNELDEEEKKILQLKSTNNFTQVGEHFGRSREWARKIHRATMEKFDKVLGLYEE